MNNIKTWKGLFYMRTTNYMSNMLTIIFFFVSIVQFIVAVFNSGGRYVNVPSGILLFAYGIIWSGNLELVFGNFNYYALPINGFAVMKEKTITVLLLSLFYFIILSILLLFIHKVFLPIENLIGILLSLLFMEIISIFFALLRYSIVLSKTKTAYRISTLIVFIPLLIFTEPVQNFLSTFRLYPFKTLAVTISICGLLLIPIYKFGNRQFLKAKTWKS